MYDLSKIPLSDVLLGNTSSGCAWVDWEVCQAGEVFPPSLRKPSARISIR